MTFGEKVKETRLALNMSQAELAQLTGISERSLYTYEQLGTMPRTSNIKKIASALKVSVTYLMDKDETDPEKHIEQDEFVKAARDEFGSKGAKEAQEVIHRAGALFAGGELDEEAKEVFFQSLMEVYLDSKQAARDKFTPKKYRKSRKRSSES
ncbi:MAG: XRE family transcriptional regulator [Clostridia bacterium]|jgi:transcriptional regulator with XRE-family HTH domain|nr:XRE family transcriptional regulator [Clostridia bacterium]